MRIINNLKKLHDKPVDLRWIFLLSGVYSLIFFIDSIEGFFWNQWVVLLMALLVSFCICFLYERGEDILDICWQP